MPVLFVRSGDITKRIAAGSLEELRTKAEKAFGATIHRLSTKEDVKERGAMTTMDVDVEDEEHFETLSALQVLDAHFPSRTAPVATASQSAAAQKPAQLTGQLTGATVATASGATVARPEGLDAPYISLSKFEYAEGRSYENWFFGGYSSAGVHYTMLKDHYRSLVYHAAMEAHADLIKGKVVMDIGSGSGIWALTAARLGAKRVIAVEAGDMAITARANVIANGYEGVIDVVHATVEDMIAQGVRYEETDGPATGKLLIGQGGGLQVDMIVSEWMGYWLLTEGVLRSVFKGRDAWLRKDGQGVMFPSHCAMYISPFEDLKWGALWDDVYGLNMAPLAEYQGKRDPNRRYPSVEIIDCDTVIAPPSVCKFVDCRLDTVESITNFDSTFSCTFVAPPADVDAQSAAAASDPTTVAGHNKAARHIRKCHGFVGSFSVFFDASATGNQRMTYESLRAKADKDEIVELTTQPATTASRETHWYQSLLLTKPFEMHVGDVVEGTLHWQPNTDEPRYYDATIGWKLNDGPVHSRTYQKC